MNINNYIYIRQQRAQVFFELEQQQRDSTQNIQPYYLQKVPLFFSILLNFTLVYFYISENDLLMDL